MNGFDSLDFEPNSLGVRVVRVIRLKDIVKALGCTEDFARGVVRDIRGETSADGSLAFVLPSQLATWAYQRAGKPVAPPPFRTVVVKDALRAAGGADSPPRAPPPAGGARGASGEVEVLASKVASEVFPKLLAALQREPHRTGAQGGLVDIKAAARHLGLSVSTVYKRANSTLLPSIKDGGRLLFRLEDLDAYATARRRSPERVAATAAAAGEKRRLREVADRARVGQNVIRNDSHHHGPETPPAGAPRRGK